MTQPSFVGPAHCGHVVMTTGNDGAGHDSHSFWTGGSNADPSRRASMPEILSLNRGGGPFKNSMYLPVERVSHFPHVGHFDTMSVTLHNFSAARLSSLGGGYASAQHLWLRMMCPVSDLWIGVLNPQKAHVPVM